MLEVRESETVFNVKAKILDHTGIPTDQQLLVYASLQLEDDQMLSSYSIGRDAILQLVLRLRAGMLQPAPSLMPNPNSGAGGSMNVDVGEGNVSEMASSTNVPPLELGALAVGTQNEREDERETSFENRDGQVVVVHP